VLRWKAKTTKFNRLLFQLAPLALRTEETESGLLPTPSTVDSGSYFNQSDSSNAAKRPTLGAMAKYGLWPTPKGHAGSMRRLKPTPVQLAGKAGMDLSVAVRIHLPTPTANRRDGLQSHGVNVISGQLNPRWVEWLMGYPSGWTDLEDSETQSSRKSHINSSSE
jgi:hypothetical protein